MNDLPRIEMVDLERAVSRRFREFIPLAWPYYQIGIPFVPSWHIDAVGDFIQAFHDKHFKVGVISMPPREGKSSSASVMYPAWTWGPAEIPSRRFCFASYGLHLSKDHAGAARRLMDDDWYQDRWGCRCPEDRPHRKECRGFRWSDDTNTKAHYANDRGGERFTASVEAGTTGFGGEILVMDDPIDLAKAKSKAYRLKAIDYIDTVWMGRRNDANTAGMLYIGQRCHQEDPIAHVLAAGGCEHLKIPREYDPKKTVVVNLGPGKVWKDPRTTKGDLLDEKRMARGEVDKLKLRPWIFSAQQQQEPIPPAGGIFKKHWWRFWQTPGIDWGPVVIPDWPDNAPAPVCVPLDIETLERLLLSFDCSQKGLVDAIQQGSNPDPVSGGSWGRKGVNLYLLDRVFGQMDFLETIEAVLLLTDRWPRAHLKLIEGKANGVPVINVLRNRVQGLHEVDPTRQGNKRDRATKAWSGPEHHARAIAMLDLVHGGNVLLPHPAMRMKAPNGEMLDFAWVLEFIDNLAAFPMAETDDDVDMTSQALAYIQSEVYFEQWKLQEDAKNPPPQNTAELVLRQKWAALRGEASSEESRPLGQSDGGML